LANLWFLELISVFLPTVSTISAIEQSCTLMNESLAATIGTAETTEKKSQRSKHQLKKEQKKVNFVLEGLLRYWITFAVIHGIGRLFTMIPLISRISKRFDESTFRQCLFVFFVWLRYLPLPHPKNKGKIFGKHASSYSTSTVDIVYSRAIAPLLVPIAKAADGENYRQNIIEVGIKQLDLFLSAMVFMKAVSSERKYRILHVLTESLDLLPASLTILMPSMFTAYGCVYVGNFISAGSSARCDASIIRCEKSASYVAENEVRLTKAYNLRVRWLRYWCIFGNMTVLLHQLSYILSWIPFSTHATLAFLIWLQLPVYGGGSFMYDVLKVELIGFGFIEINDDFNASKTLTMKLLSQFTSLKDKGEEQDEDLNEENVHKIESEGKIDMTSSMS